MTTNNDILENELRELIIASLNLEDIAPEDIEREAPLFTDGLGLDSIDALELGLALKKKYGITLAADDKENKKYFASLASLAAFVASHRAQ